MKQNPTDWPLVQAGDEATITALLHRHEPLVRKIAGRFARSRPNSFDDLKQVGTIALWNAITSFDPARGWAFSTWAHPWIMNAVSQEAATGWVIRTPKINPNHSEENKQLKRRARAAASLSEPDGDCQAVFFAKTLDPYERLEDREECVRSLLRYRRLLNTLQPRQRRVVRARLAGATYRTIGDSMRLSRQRAKQIWDQAMIQLRKGTPAESRNGRQLLRNA